MSAVIDRDLEHEARDVRPLVEVWLFEYGQIVAWFAFAMSFLFAFAAYRVVSGEVTTWAVTPRGETFQIPHYETIEDAADAAARMDAVNDAADAARTASKPPNASPAT